MKTMRRSDFTISTLEELYKSLLKCNYRIGCLSDFLAQGRGEKFCILRHDVDRGLKDSLRLARLENRLGIKATYFFRYKQAFSEKVIKKIHDLGHEIGYHYETLARAKGDYARAMDLFKKELRRFRKIVPVRTVSAHGSPLSRWDNRRLWNRDIFGEFEIVGDASASIDFNEVLYLTDTARGWNKDVGNIRDRVSNRFNYTFNTTHDIIKIADCGELPDKIMLSIHPHRWSDNPFAWTIELVGQGVKNLLKESIIWRQKICT